MALRLMGASWLVSTHGVWRYGSRARRLGVGNGMEKGHGDRNGAKFTLHIQHTHESTRLYPLLHVLIMAI